MAPSETAVADASSATTPETKPLYGVWSPALTPVDADYRPDTARFVAHASWLLDSGCHGVGVFGTTGEANSFSVEEREAVLTAAAAALPQDRIMAGTGCCALTDTVRLTRHAVGVGLDTVLMLPPFYYKGLSDDALADYFGQVIERVDAPDLRIVLYHFPRLTGVPVTAGLIERLLARFPQTVVGVKDSGGDWDNTAMLIERFPELAIFPGSETFLLQGLRAGGAGCITASANVNAAAIRSTYEAFAAGDGAAADAQAIATVARRAIETRAMVPALKHIVAARRADPEWARTRPPIQPLDAAAGAALLADLAALDFPLDGI